MSKPHTPREKIRDSHVVTTVGENERLLYVDQNARIRAGCTIC